MASARVNGVELYYELSGTGEPLVLVHGSWTNADGWAALAPRLADRFRTLAYDRRGHSRSERPPSQGSVDEDSRDLEELIGALGLAPAHVVTGSHGGNVAMRLAARRPELFRSLSMHEPPAFGALGDTPEEHEARELNEKVDEMVRKPLEAGENETAARLFVDEIAFGPGTWENQLPAAVREAMVYNAPTYLDELRDPGNLETPLAELAGFEAPVQITTGTESPAFFALIAERLAAAFPDCRRRTIEGAGHAPQLTHSGPYAELLADFAS